jgi:uncharacterized protein DUF6378
MVNEVHGQLAALKFEVGTAYKPAESFFDICAEPQTIQQLQDAVNERIGKPETILQEAQRLVHGDRQASYGHPSDDFARTGKMWAAILGLPHVTPEQVGLCMCAVKISRQCNSPKRDNLTDLAGYAATVQMVEERKRV